MAMKKMVHHSLKAAKGLLLAAGLVFMVLCIVAFTTLPYHLYHRLATYALPGKLPPKAIVMLSGAGIPSENGLIRAYFTASLAERYPDAKIIIAAPGDLSDSMSDPVQISRELILRGVNPQKISFEAVGKNTRGQAMNLISGSGKGLRNSNILLVTSPEHVKRAVKTFRRAGFSWVCAIPTFESSLSDDLTFDDTDLKGNKMVPPIGGNMQLRYQFWNHLKYEIIIIREYFALGFYKLKGWA